MMADKNQSKVGRCGSCRQGKSVKQSSPSEATLPIVVSNTLPNQRNNIRESLCGQENQSEKTPFPPLPKAPSAGVTTNKSASSTVFPVVQPMASSPTNSNLLLPTSGESPSRKNVTSPISRNSSSPESFRPTLNTNYFLWPESLVAKVIKNVKPTVLCPTNIQPADWNLSLVTGEFKPYYGGSTRPRNIGVSQDKATVHITTPTPSTHDTLSSGGVAFSQKAGTPPRHLIDKSKPQTPTKEVPLQPPGVPEEVTCISPIYTGQGGKECDEAKEPDSFVNNTGSATDLQPDQVEAKGAALEDCCTHDENEDEEGSECSSLSAASSKDSLVKISRKCVNVMTKSLSKSEKVVRPAFIFSLFKSVRPTIYFGTQNETVEKISWEMRKFLRWKLTSVTPNIIKETVKRSHFKVTPANDDWLGCWDRHMKSPDFRNIREYQKFNHFPGSFQIGRKDHLWRNLSRMQSQFGKTDFDFFPQSFVLPQDGKLLQKAWESNSDQKWIVKPPASSRGIGIQVIHKWNQLPQSRPLLVQRYLQKPYLIRGNKFDLRIYVYITSFDPLRIYRFSDGLVRFASCKYSPSTKTLNNKFMHLTNYSVNKKNPQYQDNSDVTACQGHKWALKALWKYLRQKGVNTDVIWKKIKDAIIKTIISSEHSVTNLVNLYVQRPSSCHELFGFDIMLDKNLKPWVLEVNTSPSLHTNSALDVSIKGQMIPDILNLAGFVLPDMEDNMSNSSTFSLTCSPKDKHGMTPEHVAAQIMKKNYYLARKLPDSKFYSSVLDVLTPDDVRVLVEVEDEFARRGGFERIFPSSTSFRYLRFFEQPRYYNILTTQWEQKYHGCKPKGLDLLQRWCCKGLHMGIITDSTPLWAPPAALQAASKGSVPPNAFRKPEPRRLKKHVFSEDGATPNPKKCLDSLPRLPGKPSALKDTEDTNKEISLCPQALPVIKGSRQTSIPSDSTTPQLPQPELLHGRFEHDRPPIQKN